GVGLPPRPEVRVARVGAVVVAWRSSALVIAQRADPIGDAEVVGSEVQHQERQLLGYQVADGLHRVCLRGEVQRGSIDTDELLGAWVVVAAAVAGPSVLRAGGRSLELVQDLVADA